MNKGRWWCSRYGRALLLCALALPTISSAEGLRFWFEIAPSPIDRFSGAVLWMKGEIAAGDSTRLNDFLQSNKELFVRSGDRISLAIDGGDVIEAWKIGEIIRDAMIEVRLTDTGRARCVSACFFIFVSAASRVAEEGTVGVHRPHIDAASLARATPEQVRDRYSLLLSETSKNLDELLIPRDIIEKIMRTPPSESYSLTRDELDRIGDTAPWFDDYSAARCDVAPGLQMRLRKAEAARYELEAEALRQQWGNVSKCIDGLRREQRQQLVEKWRATPTQ